MQQYFKQLKPQMKERASVLVALWGMAFGGVQVGWLTWLTGTIPDEAETGGGIQIAAIQLAITTGASVGVRRGWSAGSPWKRILPKGATSTAPHSMKDKI